MGHPSTLRALVACLLVGSAALAQQGLIAEPWPKAAPVSAPMAAPRVMPASGLPPESPVAARPAAVPAATVSETAAPVQAKWSPPVVSLLVDPWKRTAVTSPPPRPRWLPLQPEIIDPWAREQSPKAPRVASRPAAAPVRSTIF